MIKCLSSCLLLFCGTQAAAQASSTEIVVGQVLGNEVGQTINGWSHLAGGMFTKRITVNFVTTETSGCCSAIFEKADQILILRTEPLARNATGGVLAERVTERLVVKKKSGEISVGDCNVLWILPSWTLLNQRTGAARSFFVTNDGIRQLSWVDDQGNCDLGD